MDKKKILKGQKCTLKRSKKVVLYNHMIQDPKYINPETIKSILIQAIMEGDMEMLKDALISQIHLHKKTELVKKSKLGRQTLYDLINDKREFNPTIKTLSSLLRAIAT